MVCPSLLGRDTDVPILIVTANHDREFSYWGCSW